MKRYVKGGALLAFLVLSVCSCQEAKSTAYAVAETAKGGFNLAAEGIAAAGEKIQNAIKRPAEAERQAVAPTEAPQHASYAPGGQRGVISPTTQPVTLVCPSFSGCGAKQLTDEWCWAACAQMIYKYHRKDVPQEQIAARIRGQSDQQTAGYFEILRALSETDELWHDKFARVFDSKNIQLDPGSFVGAFTGLLADNDHLLVQQLVQREPCVVGLLIDRELNLGHAVVAYEVTYTAQKNFWAGADGKDGRTNRAPPPRRANAKPLFHVGNSKGSRSTPAVTSTNVGGDKLFEIPDVDVSIVSVKVFDPAPGKGARTLDAQQLKEQLQFVVSRNVAQRFNQNLEDTIKVR